MNASNYMMKEKNLADILTKLRGTPIPEKLEHQGQQKSECGLETMKTTDYQHRFEKFIEDSGTTHKKVQHRPAALEKKEGAANMPLWRPWH